MGSGIHTGVGRSGEENSLYSYCASAADRQKKVFFHVGYASFDRCLDDQLRLVPDDDQLPGPKADYDAFRATPPNQLNDINEINFKPVFVDDEKNRENINREYASTLTELFPTSPVSIDDMERYRQKYPLVYGAELTCDQLSKRYGVTLR